MSSIKVNIALLGATGSIGKNTLEIISNHPDKFNLFACSVHNNIDELHSIINNFSPEFVVITNTDAGNKFKKSYSGNSKIIIGKEGLVEIASMDKVDTVVAAIVGFAGLESVIAALKSKKRVALANKETLVVAGHLITEIANKNNSKIIPVDSEHSAIFQCLQGEPENSISKIILTASGGPFRNLSLNELQNVTINQALNHPNWKMGKKVSIDSATMMNKGLEVIEAHWLFGLPKEKIKVLIHPQSIIHSMVEFVDGSVKAQMGIPDMKIPIQYALTFPERIISSNSKMNFSELKELTFMEVDKNKFPMLELAYFALEQGGTMPAIMNAANEVAVNSFLNGLVHFTKISDITSQIMLKHKLVQFPSIDDIFEADRWGRDAAENLIKK